VVSVVLDPDGVVCGDAIDIYRAAGWSRVFPLPAREKDPPPPGITGKDGTAPDLATLERFRRWPVDSNVGIAMPHDLIGVDVDQYGDKRGADNLAAFVRQAGVRLPPTWRSTSRGAGNLSGIRFYRVPPGLFWRTAPLPGVELIAWHHRYAVVWPSIHPEGRAYQWYDDANEPVDRPPIVAHDWPDLPWQYVQAWTRAEEEPADFQPAAPQHAARPAWHPKVAAKLDEYTRRPPGTARHEAARAACMALCRLEQFGLAGATSALGELAQRFLADVAPDRGHHTAAAEWGRLLSGGRVRAQTTAATTTVGNVTVLPPNGTDPRTGGIDQPADTNGPGPGINTDEFWSDPILNHIHTAARAQLSCPWSVLGCVLARVVCLAPVTVVLPAVIHDYASLNLTVALVGPSGSGKGGAVGVARRAVDLDPIGFGPGFSTHTLGSGQGIAHGYGHYEKGRDGEPGGVVRHAESVLFTVEEVDHIAAHGNQNASTILAELRRFSMGEKLGHLYVDPNRRVEIAAHTYRGAILILSRSRKCGSGRKLT
jgi:hypothetical protein